MRTFPAHRFAFLLAHDRFPAPGMVLLHSCDRPACCNPGHLREGTCAENSRDMLAKGRSNPGSGRSYAVLHETDVASIRLKSASGVSTRSLAREYGVAQSTIYSAITRRNWKHVA
ncbi:MAG: HNH endonuclease [Gemmatimonadota bacterium]